MAKAAKRSYQDEYLQILRDLDGDAAGRAAGEAYFASSLARGEERCAWASNPMILDAAQYDVLNGAAVTMGSIMEKVMAKYHRDRSFRKLLGLSPEVEDLTMVPSGCHAAVPLSRIDLLFDPATHDFTICGITTGGIDGMAMSAEVNRAVRSTNAFASFAKTHKSIETFDAMEAAVLSVLHTYGKWANAEEGRNHPTHPSLAVLDVKDSPRASENATVVEVMQGKGIYARTTTFETLRIAEVGGIRQLVDDRGPVTCVWLWCAPWAAIAHGRAARAPSCSFWAARSASSCSAATSVPSSPRMRLTCASWCPRSISLSSTTSRTGCSRPPTGTGPPTSCTEATSPRPSGASAWSSPSSVVMPSSATCRRTRHLSSRPTANAT